MNKTLPIRFNRLLVSALIGLAAAALWLGLPTPRPALGAPAAQVFIVNSPADFPDADPAAGCDTVPGNQVCTLRGAIQAANAHPGADTIQLQANTTYLLTRTGPPGNNSLNGQLAISESVTLLGAGPDSTLIDGNGGLTGERVFQITGTVTISGVTLQHGQSDFGGGLLNNGGLTLVNTHVVSNTSGNANNFGGGIYDDGALTLTDSLVSGNTTGAHNAYGGGIMNGFSGPLTLIDSTVSNNLTLGGPGSNGFGGGIYSDGPATLINSTVSGNTGAQGGGLDNPGSTLTLINSTVSGNFSTGAGGGIFNSAGLAQLFNTTVTQNRANTSGLSGGAGGGVANHAGATFTFANSLVAQNTILVIVFEHPHEILDDDCSGQLSANGNDLMFDINPAHCTVSSTVTLADPLLGPLQDNGGPTFTHALLPGSPAIDAGNTGGCTDNVGALLTTDQRGQPRPANGAGLTQCDIGAYELQRVVELPLLQR